MVSRISYPDIHSDFSSSDGYQTTRNNDRLLFTAKQYERLWLSPFIMYDAIISSCLHICFLHVYAIMPFSFCQAQKLHLVSAYINCILTANPYTNDLSFFDNSDLYG